MPEAIPILLYHGVPRPISDDRNPLGVPYERFLAHLDAVIDSGRTPLTIAEVADGLRRERPLPERPIAITFDDGYEDTLEAVMRVCDRALRATVYVTTGEIGSPTMLDRAQLSVLAERPDAVELGAHTVTHPRLDELHREEIQREVHASKAQLEQMLGRAVDSFAYPCGAYDHRVRQIVVSAGFRSAAAVKNALSHPDDDPWAIARWTVRRSTSAEQIARLLDGQGAPRAWSHERVRTRAYRAARRFRHSWSLTE